MPSFDVVSELELHEVSNAVDQANREIGNRFDFKGVDASFTLDDATVKMQADAEFQLQQMSDILYNKLTKRGVDIACVDKGKAEPTGKQVRQAVRLRSGIESDLAKKLVRKIKDSKLKVQASIQGEQLRVTGKKRDDLQAAIALLKGADDVDMPLQFKNFRD